MLTQEQNEKISEIFAANFDSKAFMRPTIEGPQKWFIIETEFGETHIAHQANNIVDNSQDLFFEDGIAESGKYTVEEKVCYGAQLEAPGYLDQTAWTLGDDPVQLAQELAYMYGEPQEEEDEETDEADEEVTLNCVRCKQPCKKNGYGDMVCITVECEAFAQPIK